MKVTINLNNYLEISNFSFYNGYDDYKLAQSINQIFLSKTGQLNLDNLQIITNLDLNIPLSLFSAININNWQI